MLKEQKVLLFVLKRTASTTLIIQCKLNNIGTCQVKESESN